MTIATLLRRACVLAAAVLLVASAGVQPGYAVDNNSPEAAAAAKKHRKPANKESKAKTKPSPNTPADSSPHIGYDPNNGY
jgi:hypothetical protein